MTAAVGGPRLRLSGRTARPSSRCEAETSSASQLDFPGRNHGYPPPAPLPFRCCRSPPRRCAPRIAAGNITVIVPYPPRRAST